MAKFLTDLHLVRFKDRKGKAFATLSEEYRVEVDGKTITVPAGFVTDLASVPRRLRGIVSLDRGVEAAVIHDYLYANQIGTRKEADLIFKKLLELTESPATVWTMYWAVRACGRWAWNS